LVKCVVVTPSKPQSFVKRIGLGLMAESVAGTSLAIDNSLDNDASATVERRSTEGSIDGSRHEAVCVRDQQKLTRMANTLFIVLL